jgi:hypothetical protein
MAVHCLNGPHGPRVALVVARPQMSPPSLYSYSAFGFAAMRSFIVSIFATTPTYSRSIIMCMASRGPKLTDVLTGVYYRACRSMSSVLGWIPSETQWVGAADEMVLRSHRPEIQHRASGHTLRCTDMSKIRLCQSALRGGLRSASCTSHGKDGYSSGGLRVSLTDRKPIWS